MPELILVHIGESFPDYLNTCIAQVASVSDIRIHVLVNECNKDKVKGAAIVRPLESIVKDDLQRQFETQSRLDTTFRGGFWQFASLRFFYLYNYIKMAGLTDIFHIEYDNLIYYDVFQKMDPFRSKEMWCVMDAPNRCIPSFLFWKGPAILEQMLTTMIECSTRKLNDMESLAVFYKSNKEIVGALPIVTAYVDSIDPLYSEHAATFGYLFDGACVGQYIGGVDPRNAAGNTVGFINETSVIKCNKMTVAFVDKKPVLNGMPLVNLHIHSKNLARWTSC
jgi:hypothetical protein